MALNKIEEIIEDIRNGKMVVIMDDEDRENEGDIIMAAEKVRAEDINFMARYARGLICLTLTKERCEQLHLPLMVPDNGSKHGTNFTVSIEAATGVTTGISAADRARTVQAAVAKDAKPTDIVQPGHIFPLMAQPGGVMARAGHTETGCDLARMAGLEPSSVIVEILNEDGTMARRDDLIKFAQEHKLKVGTVADLITYRTKHEKTVECVGQCEFPTEFGAFHLYTYQDSIDNAVHLALVKGQLSGKETPLVRVHLENPLYDMLGGIKPHSSLSLRRALREIGNVETGIVVVLREPDATGNLIRTLQDMQKPTENVGDQSGSSPYLRTYGIGAQILSDLGVTKMRVLSAPKKMNALSGFGLEVVEYLSPEASTLVHRLEGKKS